ncbi:MAG: hypothetical protein ACI9FJ_003351 [Alteromonadaceae bacterium]|jgi:hypothetical protein
MKKSLATFALLSTVIATSAAAKEMKHLNKTMDITEGQPISISVPVGSLKVQACDCNEIDIQIEVESANGGWNIFSSGGDVDSAELKIEQHNGKISFEVDEDDTKQRWLVTLPATSALSFDMGVGSVEIKDLNNDLDADVGVGSLAIDVSSDNYRHIELDSGVGDTTIRGFKGDVTNKRSVVSSSANYRGEGQYFIAADVGVGEASVSN